MKYFTTKHINALLTKVTDWAKDQPDIFGVALVGSYARDQAREDSDIDLIILTNDPAKYLINIEWLNGFGEVLSVRSADYGMVTSLHVKYLNSHEIEFGITLPAWTSVPTDSGTREVIMDGIVALYDPQKLFSECIAKTDLTNLILISDRLKLLPLTMEYAQPMCQHFTPEVTRYMWPSAPKIHEDVNQYIKSQQHQMKYGNELAMVIVTKHTAEFLGHVCIHQAHSQTPELGIWLKSDAQGHRYGYEALNLLKQWAKLNLQYHHLKYPVDKKNVPSRKLAESLGGYVGDEYIKISESGNELDEVEYWIV